MSRVEHVDLVYLILKKMLNGVTVNDRNVEVGYIYDYKLVDVGVKDWVLLYDTGEGAEYGELGGGIIHTKGKVSIDVRTNSKYSYGVLKNYIRKVLGNEYEFTVTTPTDITSVVTNIVEKGTYVDYVAVSDATGISEGDYVQYASDRTGWVFWLNGTSLWIFKKAGKFYMIKENFLNDLSNKMKNLFRFVMDVEVRAYISIE